MPIRYEGGLLAPSFLSELLWMFVLHVVQSFIICCHVKGVQAQTVANFYLAFEAQLAIIPVINKVHCHLPVVDLITYYFSTCRSNLTLLPQIDLKNADPERVESQVEKAFDIPREECIRVSWSICKMLFSFQCHLSEKCLFICGLIIFRFLLNLEQMLTRFSKRLWTEFHRKKCLVFFFGLISHRKYEFDT